MFEIPCPSSSRPCCRVYVSSSAVVLFYPVSVKGLRCSRYKETRDAFVTQLSAKSFARAKLFNYFLQITLSLYASEKLISIPERTRALTSFGFQRSWKIPCDEWPAFLWIINRFVLNRFSSVDFSHDYTKPSTTLIEYKTALSTSYPRNWYCCITTTITAWLYCYVRSVGKLELACHEVFPIIGDASKTEVRNVARSTGIFSRWLTQGPVRKDGRENAAVAHTWYKRIREQGRRCCMKRDSKLL